MAHVLVREHAAIEATLSALDHRAALPETSSRADDSDRAADGFAQSLDQTVGTPKYSVPPAAA